MIRFVRQRPAAGVGQLVKLSAALVFRLAPFRVDQSVQLQGSRRWSAG